jgi:hypothetical protein
MKWYKAKRGWQKIEEIEIDRESGSTVYFTDKFGNHSERKMTNWYGYFPTYEKAKSFLVKDEQEKVNRLEAQLIQAKANLFTAQNL